jgi:hypothetical protein
MLPALRLADASNPESRDELAIEAFSLSPSPHDPNLDVR